MTERVATLEELDRETGVRWARRTDGPTTCPCGKPQPVTLEHLATCSTVLPSVRHWAQTKGAVR